MSWSISNAEAALQKKLQRPYKPLLPWLVSPLVQPEYVFCRDAIAIVGKAMFGDEWKEGDLLAIDWWESPEQIYRNHWNHELATNGSLARRISIPRSILSNDWGPTESSETEEDFESRKLEHFQHCTDALKAIPQSVADLQAEWQANADATQRLLKAIGWVGDKCRAGLIRGAYQFHNSYELKEDMNKQLWNCTSDAGHWAKAGGISFKGNDYTHHIWVFVHRGDMEREIRTLANSQSLATMIDLSKLPPYLKFAVDLALANGWVDGFSDTNDVRESEIKARWNDALPGIPMGAKAIDSIRLVTGFPDVGAVRRSVETSKTKKIG